MTRSLIGLALLLLLCARVGSADPLTATNGTGAGSSSGHIACTGTVHFPAGVQGFQVSSTTTASTTPGDGAAVCTRVVMPCDLSVGRLAFRIVTGAGTGEQCAIAIYDAATGARVINTGILSGAGSGACEVSGQKNLTVSPAVTLQQGRIYYYCFAHTATGTLVAVKPVATGDSLFNDANFDGNSLPYSALSNNNIPMPADCVGLDNPYAGLCTGPATCPSCSGFPTTIAGLGLSTNSFVSSTYPPWLMLHQ